MGQLDFVAKHTDEQDEFKPAIIQARQSGLFGSVLDDIEFYTKLDELGNTALAKNSDSTDKHVIELTMGDRDLELVGMAAALDQNHAFDVVSSDVEKSFSADYVNPSNLPLEDLRHFKGESSQLAWNEAAVTSGILTAINNHFNQ